MFTEHASHDASFPPSGKMLVIGVDADIPMRARYDKRVYFWDASQITGKASIPPKVAAITVHRHNVNEGDVRRIQDCARAKGILRVTFESSLASLRGRLETTFRDIDLTVDPDRPVAPAISGKIENPDTARLDCKLPALPEPLPVEEAILAAGNQPSAPAPPQDPPQTLREFVVRFADLRAPSAIGEAERLLPLVRKQLNLGTIGSITQEIRRLKQRQNANGGPDSHSGHTRHQRATTIPIGPSDDGLSVQLESLIAQMKQRHVQDVEILSGLLTRFRSTERENAQLVDEIERLREEVKDIPKLKKDSNTLAQMLRVAQGGTSK
jgi:hypothetical protein